MRWTAFALTALVGCAADPPCGVDESDNERPHCEWKVDQVPEAIIQCPGDDWVTPECKTCACTDAGKILCTDVQAGCLGTSTPAGS